MGALYVPDSYGGYVCSCAIKQQEPFKYYKQKVTWVRVMLDGHTWFPGILYEDPSVSWQHA